MGKIALEEHVILGREDPPGDSDAGPVTRPWPADRHGNPPAAGAQPADRQPDAAGGCILPVVSQGTSDAKGLAELPQFPADWLAADPGQLGASLALFTRSGGPRRRCPLRPDPVSPFRSAAATASMPPPGTCPATRYMRTRR